MRKRKRILIFILVFSCLSVSACSKTDVTENTESQTDSQMNDKGYDLPVANEVREKAESDCINIMKMIQGIYTDADKGDASNAVISNETAKKMMEVLEGTKYPVSAGSFPFDMTKYEKMEGFLEASSEGKEGEIVIYELHTNGGIARNQYTFDGKDMYVLCSTAMWSEENTPGLASTSYTRIREWEYTKKGWFSYEHCVPEPPEVSETFNGNVLMRVKPMKEEYRETALKYLESIGYKGNNLFCTNWDLENLDAVDYNGLFQYLYAMHYGKNLDSGQYEDGIPKEEFENLMMEYLPVTAEQLEQYAVYDQERQMYGWAKLGAGTYVPSAFSTSLPEITDIQEKEDGTSVISVDAVCEMLGNDQVFTHEITVKFKEDGGMIYLGNHISGVGAEQMAEYQFRAREK